MGKKNDKKTAASTKGLDEVPNSVPTENEAPEQHSDSDIPSAEPASLDVAEQPSEPLDEETESAIQAQEAEWDREKKSQDQSPVSSGVVVVSAILHSGKMYHRDEVPHGIEEPHLSILIASGAIRKESE